MSPGYIFQICSTIAMIAWLLLIIGSLFLPSIDKFLIGIVIILFCIVYAWLIISSFTLSDFKYFGSLQGVMTLFKDETVVTAGWVHYLAFDLLAGIWIKRNSLKHGISHWLIIPCLIFTFMLGPVGLLLYIFVRTIATNNYFAENF